MAHVHTAQASRATPPGNASCSTGPLAFLPLNDGRCSIVWSVARPEAASFASARSCGLRRRPDRGQRRGARGSATLTSQLASFPLKLQYAVRLRRGRARCCSAMPRTWCIRSPGRDLNLGLLDCAALAQVLRRSGGRRKLRRPQAAAPLRALAAQREPASRQPRWTAWSGCSPIPDRVQYGTARRGLERRGRMPFVKRAFAAARLRDSGGRAGRFLRRPVYLCRANEIVHRQSADRMRGVGDMAVVVAHAPGPG